MLELYVLVAMHLMESAAAQYMTGHILGGEFTKINMYPHAVSLDVYSKTSFLCGGSILNQDIILTAAHCFDEYLGRKKDSVIIKYGATALQRMSQTKMKFYRLHDYYNEFSMYGDLSLILCETPIKLGTVVKRVVIMSKPPTEHVGYVSGWGDVNGMAKGSITLKHTSQKIQARRVCNKYLSFPSGTFCAGPIQGLGHPGVGDSGGALMIKDFIQIGIVSYKEDNSSLVVYTSISYYYNWIKENAKKTYCARWMM